VHRLGANQPTNVELVVRQIGAAICAELPPQDLCIRSGVHEHVALLQSSLKEADQLVERVRARAAKRIEKTAWRERPYGITVALVPLGNLIELAPSEILTAASERAHARMVDLLNGP
jgi:hypothetical protein